jgi:hypothetical protein
MKVTCKCFGDVKGVELRSSPFIKDDNVIEIIPNHTTMHVEHIIFNNNWFKLQGEDAYLLMWLRTQSGLIDYVCNRGLLKTFEKRDLVDHVSDKKMQTKQNNIEEIKPIQNNYIVKEFSKMKIEEIQTLEFEKPLKKIGRTKKERIPATVRNIVWVTHFHESKKGKCWLCKVEDISSANFECGHVVSEKNGGKPTIDNLKPVCSFCNKSVGTMNMEDFRRKYNIP